MKGRLLFLLGRGLLALAFIGPGGMHLLEGWREQQMSASTAVALLEVRAGFAVLLGWQVRVGGKHEPIHAAAAHPFRSTTRCTSGTNGDPIGRLWIPVRPERSEQSKSGRPRTPAHGRPLKSAE